MKNNRLIKKDFSLQRFWHHIFSRGSELKHVNMAVPSMIHIPD